MALPEGETKYHVYHTADSVFIDAYLGEYLESDLSQFADSEGIFYSSIQVAAPFSNAAGIYFYRFVDGAAPNENIIANDLVKAYRTRKLAELRANIQATFMSYEFTTVWPPVLDAIVGFAYWIEAGSPQAPAQNPAIEAARRNWILWKYANAKIQAQLAAHAAYINNAGRTAAELITYNPSITIPPFVDPEAGGQ